MSLEDTKNSIKAIVDSTKDYQTSINAIQRDLLSLGDDVNSSAVAVATDITSSQVVSNCMNYAMQIVDSINKSLEATRTTLSTLTSDANKKLKELVDNYNNSLDPESKETRLSYVEVNLTSVDGTVTCAVDANGVKKPKGNNNYGNYGDYGDNGNNDTPEVPSDTPPEAFDLDYYLGLLGTTGVNSSEIENWDEEIKKFLEENELDQYIKKIELDGDTIKVTLSNDKEVELKDITNKEEFLEKIKEILKEEGLIEE